MQDQKIQESLDKLHEEMSSAIGLFAQNTGGKYILEAEINTIEITCVEDARPKFTYSLRLDAEKKEKVTSI